MLLRHGTKPTEGYEEAVGVSGMWYMAQGIRPSCMTPEARYSFYLAFDIMPDEQVAFEDHYRSMTLQLRAPMMFPDITAFDRDNNPLALWSSARKHL